MYNVLIQKAINKATELYNGKVRKGDGLPYIVHPFSVVLILLDYTDDENIIVAGLLHDVLEDVSGYSEFDMERDFGKKITQIVKEVSEEENLGRENWKERKQGYLAHLQNASYEAMMVCAADKIHNLRSLIDAYQKYGKKIFKEFNASMEEKLDFYGKVLEILERKLQNDIVKELKNVYKTAKTILIQ